ncbi:Platinum sensitivity protein [Polyrhizophydium stewartii]|uniref:Platinum sensitivity protein n=1 Tax=Polyrhizophydium stewartii TaxID=2732419 RepID=A0ABR4NEP4_9FUNG
MSSSTGRKQEACRFYALGYCERGQSCHFRHDRRAHKVVCPFYLQGTCQYGRRCMLSHTQPKPPPATAQRQPATQGQQAAKSRPSPAAAARAAAPAAVSAPAATSAPAADPAAALIQPFRGLSYSGVAQVQPAAASRPLPVGTVVPSGTSIVPAAGAGSSASMRDRLCPFALKGKCRYGTACRYVHGMPCPYCHLNCLVPGESTEENSAHLRECKDKFLSGEAFEEQFIQDQECAVCLEVVSSKRDPRFGLMDCHHSICLECIRTWRTNERMETAKSCPVCRTVTYLVVPSSVWPADAATKQRIVQEYRDRLSKIDCKHFKFGEGTCPFSTSCLYRHADRTGAEVHAKPRFLVNAEDAADGTAHVLKQVQLFDFLEHYDGQAGTAEGAADADAPEADAVTAAAAAAAAAAGGALSRVKVYEMDAAAQWVDKGTGHIAKDGLALVVRSEVDGTAIMNTQVGRETNYQRQQDTLIVWSEPGVSDLALSFQEAAGCADMWKHIQDIQGHLGADRPDIDLFPMVEDTFAEDTQQIVLELPEPELKNLAEIEQILMHTSRSMHMRDMLARYILESGYIEKLLPLLEICEDLESKSDLFMLSNIMRCIIFLSDQGIYELILREEVFPLVVGILEYDKEFEHLKANHREYLESQAKFKEVIPIKNQYIVTKIKQTYRVQYLKDVVLARVLDDQTFSALNAITFFNYTEIVETFRSDNEYLSDLFELLSNENESREKKKDVILFLHELSTIARNLQKPVRFEFYRALGQHGLFALFDVTLGDQDEELRIAAISILHNILDHDPALVRSFCLAQARQNHRPLIAFLIERFHNEPDMGLRSQTADCLRSVLDTSGGDSIEELVQRPPQDSESEEFLKLFYDGHCAKMFEPLEQLEKLPLTDLRDGSQVLLLDPQLSSICGHLCELLCFNVSNHGMISKHFILTSEVLRRTTLLLKAKESHLRLSAVRVFRTCMNTNDEFYRRILVKKDIFGPVFAALLATKGRYNLLNSACLEFFDYIRRTPNTKAVVAHIVQNYRKFFPALDYVETFKLLERAHEQSLLGDIAGDAEPVQQDTRSLPRRDGWARQDTAEEDYFNESDDEDDGPNDNDTPSAAQSAAAAAAASAAVMTKPVTPPKMIARAGVKRAPSSPLELARGRRPLVDYPDDEDDDEEEEMIGIKRRPMRARAVSQRITIAIQGSLKSAVAGAGSPKATKIDGGPMTNGSGPHMNQNARVKADPDAVKKDGGGSGGGGGENDGNGASVHGARGRGSESSSAADAGADDDGADAAGGGAVAGASPDVRSDAESVASDRRPKKTRVA